MNKQEIKQKISKKKDEIKNWKASMSIASDSIKELVEDIYVLENELKILDNIKIYEPILMEKISSKEILTEDHIDYNLRVDRYNASEELKRLISIENAERRWKVDWSAKQDNYYIEAYEVGSEKVFVDSRRYERSQEDEFYFSLVSAEDKDFIDKITPFWLKAKGIV